MSGEFRVPSSELRESPRKAGLFITFEGVEGAGKSTHIRRLAAWLENGGREALLTREPGGHPLGEEIRRLLLSSEPAPTARAELMLFLAARAQLTERVLMPRLEAGEIVICDRFIDSTVAYQGFARAHAVSPGDEAQWVECVRALNNIATAGLKPDLTILLDLDPGAGLARQKNTNRMESEALEFHLKVRAGYLNEAAREPERFRIVDASRSQDDVFRDILDAVKPRLTSGE